MARARYIVNLPERGNEDFTYTYYCFAPAFFLAREPTHEERLAFVDQLKSRYNPRVLSEHAFQCTSCLRPAHQTVNWITYSLRDPGCLAVNDTFLPICKAASCAKKAQRSLHEHVKSVVRREGGSSFGPEILSCRSCFRDFCKERPCQACARCQATLYCSSECQKLDWKRHKGQCKGRVEAAKLTVDQLAQLDTLVRLGTGGTTELLHFNHRGKLPAKAEALLGTTLQCGQEAAVARYAKTASLSKEEAAKLWPLHIPPTPEQKHDLEGARLDVLKLFGLQVQ